MKKFISYFKITIYVSRRSSILSLTLLTEAKYVRVSIVSFIKLSVSVLSHFVAAVGVQGGGNVWVFGRVPAIVFWLRFGDLF